MERDYGMIDDMRLYDTPFYMRDIEKFIECFGINEDDLNLDDYSL